MAMGYKPSVPAELYEGDDGRLYGPDLNQYFKCVILKEEQPTSSDLENSEEDLD